MAGVQKPIVITNGAFEEVPPAVQSAGAPDGGRLIALNPGGQIDPTLLPTTNSINGTASEAIAAGAIVNLFDGGVRNADAASGKEADGYAVAAAASGAPVTVVLREGLNALLSGLEPGVRYFLGANGAVTKTPPTAAGSILQFLGRAKSATELSFQVGTAVKRA